MDDNETPQNPLQVIMFRERMRDRQVKEAINGTPPSITDDRPAAIPLKSSILLSDAPIMPRYVSNIKTSTTNCLTNVKVQQRLFAPMSYKTATTPCIDKLTKEEGNKHILNLKSDNTETAVFEHTEPSLVDGGETPPTPYVSNGYNAEKPLLSTSRQSDCHPIFRSKLLYNSDEDTPVLSPQKKQSAVSSETPRTSPSRVNKVERIADDDTDDMDLLFGSVTPQKRTRPQRKPITTTNVHSQPTNHRDTAAYLDMRSLPWSDKSNYKRREEITTFFEGTFCTLIHNDNSMNEIFAPFVVPKHVRRYADAISQLYGNGTVTCVGHRSDKGSTVSRNLLPPAPVLTHNDIKCSPNIALRPYQLEGVQFLMNNFHRGISSILADDMGLGKTAQLSSFLQTLFTVHNIPGPHLIIAPLITLTNWTRELGRWAPSLHVHKHHGSTKTRSSNINSEHRFSVIVTSPSTFFNDRQQFRNRTWVTVTVDEAHILKNECTNITVACAKIVASMRIAVTGTPVQNTIREIWSQMSFLFPYIFDKRAEIDDDSLSAKQCASLLSVIMLRRTKGMLDLGLPPRIDEPTLMIEATPLQKELLDVISQYFSSGAVQKGSDSANVRRLFMDLRKVCNHPMQLKLLADGNRESVLGDAYTNEGGITAGLARLKSCGINLTDEEIVYPSAKMIKLDIMLSEMKTEGHRILIFSNFTSQIDLLEGLCVLRGHTYNRLDGSCSRVERELSIQSFNHKDSKIFLFLVTTTAGGVGVTLTGADTVILYDNHYNPQIDRQAADRAHRIGQTKVVHVYRMCLKDTAEEEIQRIATRKAQVGDMVVDGKMTEAAGSKFFSIQELRNMLIRRHTSKPTDGDNPTLGATSGEIETSDYNLTNRALSMKKELIRILAEGKSDKSEKQSRMSSNIKKGIFDDVRSKHCYHCKDKMLSMVALKYCTLCPKGYHAECVVDPPTTPAELRNWSCPRHNCWKCGQSHQSDGALFYCTTCPRAYCYECLDPAHFSMADDGVSFRSIKLTYPGMEEERVAIKRSAYYINCLRCQGLADSSSSDEDSPDDAQKKGVLPASNEEDGETDTSDDDDDDDDSSTTASD